jgi:hypothetical protein
LAAGAGAAANRGISGAKGSLFGVAQEAVRGQYAAEAQERNHKHTRQILKDVHKNAGEGTGVRVKVQSGDSVHDLGYTKKLIGENYRERGEKALIKEHFGKNPKRDAQGYRHDQPDHVGNAQAAVEHKPMLAIEGPKPKAETTFESASPNHTDSRVHSVKGVATGDRKAVDHGDAGSVDAHLSAEEGAHLAQRKAKLDAVKNAGRTTKTRKPRTTKPKTNWGNTQFAQGDKPLGPPQGTGNFGR